MSRIWLVTGASRGIGAGIVRALVAAGEKVVATARNVESVRKAHGEASNLLCLPLDVTKAEQAKKAIADTVEHFGRIDVLVNNAGYGQLGHFETITDKQIQDQFAVNVFGAMTVTRAVLPLMRAQRSGHVFTMSSAIGLVSVPGSTIYAASKHAIEGWMEGLAEELWPFGIAATLLDAGYFRTDFLSAQSVSYGVVAIPDYDEAEKCNHERYAKMENSKGGDPEKLGAALITMAGMKTPPVRIAAGSSALIVFKMKIDRLTKEAAEHNDLSRAMDEV